ncbi:DNA repair protein RecN [Acetobacteraceae bacterium]|nr:DNA repair protein RecN [Acetobacteraceae bacterium]
MLSSLSVRNILLIESLDLSFKKGLTVLTGETGAGKSILLETLSLLLGARGSASLIRPKADQGTISGAFEIPKQHPVWQKLEEHGISIDSDEDCFLTIRRILERDGRSRSFIADQPVSLTLLKEITSSLMEIQAQHAQIRLMDPSVHLELLDLYSDHEKLKKNVRMTWDAWQTILEKRNNHLNEIEKITREKEWLEHTIESLERLSPQPEEEKELTALRLSLQNQNKRAEAVSQAERELRGSGKSQGASAAVRNAMRILERLSPVADIKEAEAAPELSENTWEVKSSEILTALEEADNALAEAENLLNFLGNDLTTDTHLLEETEERLFALRAEARKHNINVENLANFLEELQQKLSAIENAQTYQKNLEEELLLCEKKYHQSADRLTESRLKSAISLTKTVNKELPALKLESAFFEVKLSALQPKKWGSHGKDSIVFTVAPNPGLPAAPLGKGASGGELSRLLLALHVTLAEKESTGCLIFDEVDSGAGGPTAAAIGSRLYRIGQKRQTLAVTHSPQVAACGDFHYRITKTPKYGSTITEISPLSSEERLEEIARMLAGATITTSAREAAKSLLSGSQSS